MRVSCKVLKSQSSDSLEENSYKCFKRWWGGGGRGWGVQTSKGAKPATKPA